MRATVIVDNRKNGKMQGEWGLSIYIEYRGKKLLLDAGASDLFVTNAEKLGIALEEMDLAVLSHAHYDHANGMKAFFDKNSKAKFYLRESSAENCYSKVWFLHKYIGMPRKILDEYPDRIVFAKGDLQIGEGMYLIPHKTQELETIGKREKMYQKKGKKWYPDDFSHEQSLVIESDRGLIIFNSCSHGGAVNIINEIAETFPEKKIYALIGGFHLYNKPSSEVRELGKRIKETGIQYVCTGHCTGERAYAVLKEELGGILHQLQTGMVMEFSDSNPYEYTKIRENIWQIADDDSVRCTLVQGRELAALIDTGYGKRDLRAFVEKNVQTPYIVINSHGHPDHIGGNDRFDVVYAAKEEWDVIRHFEENKHISYCLKEIQPEDRISLGDIHLKVIPLAGHTKGSIGLIVEEEKLLVAGDALNEGLWLFNYGSLSMRRLYTTIAETLKLEFDTYLCGHSDQEYPKAKLRSHLANIERLVTDKKTPQTLLGFETYQSTYEDENGRSEIVFTLDKVEAR